MKPYDAILIIPAVHPNSRVNRFICMSELYYNWIIVMHVPARITNYRMSTPIASFTKNLLHDATTITTGATLLWPWVLLPHHYHYHHHQHCCHYPDAPRPPPAAWRPAPVEFRKTKSKAIKCFGSNFLFWQCGGCLRCLRTGPFLITFGSQKVTEQKVRATPRGISTSMVGVSAVMFLLLCLWLAWLRQFKQGFMKKAVIIFMLLNIPCWL